MTNTFVTLELNFQPGVIENFVKQLPTILADTKLRSGFVHIDVYQHADDPNRLVVAEQWESAEHYRRYFQWRVESGLFDELGPILASEPRVDIWDKHLLAV